MVARLIAARGTRRNRFGTRSCRGPDSNAISTAEANVCYQPRRERSTSTACGRMAGSPAARRRQSDDVRRAAAGRRRMTSAHAAVDARQHLHRRTQAVGRDDVRWRSRRGCRLPAGSDGARAARRRAPRMAAAAATAADARRRWPPVRVPTRARAAIAGRRGRAA